MSDPIDDYLAEFTALMAKVQLPPMINAEPVKTETPIVAFAVAPWGFMIDGEFILLPKQPLLLAGFIQPPFDVELPSGQTRHIIERPEI